MVLGNKVVVETIQKIENNDVQALPQETLSENQPLKPAPKITKEFCNIDWSQDCQTVYNHIRGLSPYPAAHTQLVSESGEVIDLKVYNSEIEACTPDVAVGNVVTDNKKYLKIALSDGFIHLIQVQQAGKKAMPIADFLRGTPLNGSWKTASK
jgi:methionyl-tRNA formyltransferase